MQHRQKILVLVMALLAGVGLVLVLIYVRRRLFTRTDPIVLTT